MGRLLAIDWGQRRCGLAVTDELRIVATALTTVESSAVIPTVSKYCVQNSVDRIVIGLPLQLNGKESDSMRYIRPGVGRLAKVLPDIPIVYFDERFTSTIAHRDMIVSGMKMAKRREKGAADAMAATIILNDYLQSRQCADDDARKI